MIRALFVNSGFLGHQSVARLLMHVFADRKDLPAAAIDLSSALTTHERIVRKLLCARVGGRTGFLGSNLDFARYRGEVHAGLLAAQRIRAWERLHGPADVLHFHTQATAYLSLRRMRRTPAIVSIDCTQALAADEAPNRVERMTFAPNAAHDRAVFRRAAGIVSTSEWAAADLRRRCPESAFKVHVMPYPVRLDLFDRAWADERAARSNKPVRVLFIGGDFPRKGGPELLKAWVAADLGDRSELTIVSDWPLAEPLPTGVRHVRGVAAYTDEWRRLWREADLFVLPTRAEAFGMVFQEAAAAGVPAIGTRLNAIPEIVRDAETGILAPLGDVPALTGALRRLVDDAELRVRMGRAGRAWAERAFDPSAYADRLTALLHEAVASRPVTKCFVRNC